MTPPQPARAPRTARCLRFVLSACAAVTAAGCVHQESGEPPLAPLAQVSSGAGIATPRVNGSVAGSLPAPKVALSNGPGVIVSASVAGRQGAGGGNVQLDFADTDIREVAAQILGNMLHLNYSIDPSVHGTATLRTVAPLGEAQLIPVLQSLLAQNGATLVSSGGVYRVVPVQAAVGVAGGPGTAGGTMVPLRYAAAEDLAKVLTPYVQGGARIVAVPSANAILVAGEPAQREALESLIKSFDVDVLAGQSYALFPVANGNTEDFSTALQQAFRAQQGGQLVSQVRVVPMPRVGAVLVIANSPRYLNDARRAYAVVERGMRQTMRTWHVYYVQNSTANDVAYILQQAFTPNDVTAQPSARAQGQQSQSQGISSIGNSGGVGSTPNNSSGLGGVTGGASLGGAGGMGGGLGTGGGLGGPSSGGQGRAASSPATAGSNPLLGGLSNGGGGGSGNGGNDQNANAMRIVPNPENNAILAYATGEEEDTIEAMLHKIDILPLQVRIDVIIAEVDLNDNLSYGTQFYFTHHAIHGALAQAASALTSSGTSPTDSGAASSGGFVFNAVGAGGDIVLSALQGISTVKVLSSPELLVLDNETAQLQVGNLVPYLSAQTTVPTAGILTSGLETSNSVNYFNTGVITQITPRVNSGGLVTLDITQQVSGVAPNSGSNSTSGSSINSPTFTQRAVQTRVVVQDSQTVGLAGLITDNVSRGSSGIPFLKDIPILSFLTSNQTNARQRTELLVLLTPHVLHDQRDARALTEDLREQLPRAAYVPEELQSLPRGGSDDPLRRQRARIPVGP
jgi:general secretion pathway protein D